MNCLERGLADSEDHTKVRHYENHLQATRPRFLPHFFMHHLHPLRTLQFTPDSTGSGCQPVLPLSCSAALGEHLHLSGLGFLFQKQEAPLTCL